MVGDWHLRYTSNSLIIFDISGVLSHKAVREKIVRAFLIEEQKIVMKVLKAQKAAKE